jgi:hypothetical protein
VIAEGQLRGDLRNREARGLRGKCRRPRHARVHLDRDDATIGGIDGELNVRAACLDADPPDDAAAHVAHPLVFLVSQRQCRRDRNRVAGVDAHRIDVFDRADDDEVIGDVAHHLELEFLPADNRFFDQDFVHGAEVHATTGQLAELLDVVGDAATNAAERERRADNRRESNFLHERECFFERACDAALRHLDANLLHRVAEEQTILGDLNRVDLRAYQLDVVFGEDAALMERDRQIERRLSADGRQHGVRFLFGDDGFRGFRRQRLDVRRFRQLRVGHDRRRIAVDEDDFETLGSQRLARLRSGVVELGRLTDDDRSRTDDEYTFDVSTFWHQSRSLLFHRFEKLLEEVVGVVRTR